MANTMFDREAIINDLKNKEEMDPDKHDGCYEMMRETVSAYSKLSDLSGLDYRDLDLIYLTSAGTWKHGIDAKKKLIKSSHLHSYEMEHLIDLWDEVWENTNRHEYSNIGSGDAPSIGLFDRGKFTFKKDSDLTPEQIQAFIRMLIKLLPMTDDEEMYKCAEKVLKIRIPGVQAAAASMILHCLKPCVFPILNKHSEHGKLFEVIGVQLTDPANLNTYIDNCRKIKAFRDEHFTIKNYRIFDLEVQALARFEVNKRAWLLTWNTANLVLGILLRRLQKYGNRSENR